jgi:methanogenic corrinoid protein MtbC1
LSEHGWTVARLGADVPSGDLATFTAKNEAKLVALTASDPARLEAVAETVAAVRSVTGGVPVMLGGRLAGSRGLTESVGLDWSGTTLTGAAAFADSVLPALAPEPETQA